ncbi:MAG: 23S rRNA (adenine(2503)-C(2))-methyltransferase RlmN, partial [Spirochaetales bacterium]|nr:23S rRNA (adenine(2503)-C(2))-methyltransferase RlmN [Spirochaetales bacterium]
VSGRRFTFEYCMIRGQNTSDADADKLERFCRGLEVIVNLIPFNPCPELPFETPSDAEIRHFTNALKQRGVEYTIRISRGRTIRGACGQLAGKIEENR